MISELILFRKRGAQLVLWTCREGQRLKEAVEWCRAQGLEFDAVNENIASRLNNYPDCRKVGADIYIDDLAVTPEDFIGGKFI